ncbi:MAG: glycosyltransferase [Proteobacteria bacterium]|nr:glycosyltransferase [Pseudomonadota bacterium]
MIDLLQRLVCFPPTQPLAIPPLPIEPRLLYAVNHAYPCSSNGYAVRTHGVASALARAGVEVIAVTRPGTPWDRSGGEMSDFPLEHRIDGVRYVYLPSPSTLGKALPVYTEQAMDAFGELLRVFKPHAVMAASNWHNALPAALAARHAGLPFFYEVRGFWEISQVARDPAWAGSAGFQHEVEGETAVAQAAERLFTINRLMRDELVRRGVTTTKIDLVPNGFPGWPTPGSDRPTRESLGIQSRHVVGYVGSFNVYEGLEDLIEALALLRRRGVDVALLLVGSGEPQGFGAGQASECSATLAYLQLAARLEIRDFVFTPGRVPPEQADDYYDLLDVVVLPRRPFAVCELVSPMKPLEAAAHGKRVLMSDVAPLADLARLAPNFSYFRKGSVASLVERLLELLPAPVNTLPRCEALAELTWDKNVAPMLAAIKACAPSRPPIAGKHPE